MLLFGIFEALLIGGTIWAAIKGMGKKNGNGNGSDESKKKAGFEEKTNTHNPPAKATTFDHKEPAAVRMALIFLGYANDMFDPTMPKGSVVKQFQRDWNSVSAARFANKMPVCSTDTALGKLKVDGDPGPNTTNGLEWAKWLQGTCLEVWQKQVQAAHGAGF